MAVTIDDIARVAGVSRATVARALSGKYGTSPDTVERIKQVAAQLNYRPNRAARTLAVGRSNSVAVVVSPGIVGELQPAIEKVATRLADAEYSTLFYVLPSRSEEQNTFLEQLIYDRITGVIAVPDLQTPQPSAYREIMDSGISLVIANASVPDVRAPQVVVDDYQAVRRAAEYLISLGHKSIVYLVPVHASWSRSERIRGFTDAMKSIGIDVTPEMVMDTEFSQEAGAEAMTYLLRRDCCPTAVIAHHDVVALGCIEAVRAEGLSVPDDISVFGDGDIWCNPLLSIPLTSIRYPLARMMQIATDQLLAMLTGEQDAPRNAVLSVDLVVRSSCASRSEGAKWESDAATDLARHAVPSAMRVHPSSDVRYAVDGDYSTAYYSDWEHGWYKLEWPDQIAFTKLKIYVSGSNPLSDLSSLTVHAFGMKSYSDSFIGSGSQHELSVQQHTLNIQWWDDELGRWFDLCNVGNAAALPIGEDTLFEITVPGGYPVTTSKLRMNYASYEKPFFKIQEWKVYNTPVDVVSIGGRVIDGVSGFGLAGVRISTADGCYWTESGREGVYYLNLSAGTYDLVASRHFYLPQVLHEVTVGDGERVDGKDFVLDREPSEDMAPFANPYADNKISVLWEMMAIDGGREPFIGISNWGACGDGNFHLDWGEPVTIGRVVFIVIYGIMRAWQLYAWDDGAHDWRQIAEGVNGVNIDQVFSAESAATTRRLRLSYKLADEFDQAGLLEIRVFPLKNP